jgi:hypothetical protein
MREGFAPGASMSASAFLRQMGSEASRTWPSALVTATVAWARRQASSSSPRSTVTTITPSVSPSTSTLRA